MEEKKAETLVKVAELQALCGKELVKWRSKYFPNNRAEIEKIQGRLAKIRNEDAELRNQEEEDDLVDQLVELWSREEMLWHQRAQVN